MTTDGTGDGPPARVELLVRGMGCRHAVRAVTARLRDVAGVETVVADPRTGLVSVTVTGTMSGADLVAAVADSTYPAVVRGRPPPAGGA